MKTYGQITLTYVSDGATGAQGQAALNISLANETQNIPCSHEGLTLENTLIHIPFTGYEGLEKTACTAVVGTLPVGITLGSNTSSTTTRDGEIILNVAKNSNLGGTLTGKINLTFTIKGRKLNKQFVWTKTKDGGLSTFYTIEPSAYVIKKTVKNALSPTSITFKSYFQKDDIARQAYAGRFIIEESLNGSTYSAKYTSAKDETEVSYTPTTSNILSLRCTLCKAGTVSTVLDRQSIAVLTDASLQTEITQITNSISGVSTKVDAVEKSITDKVWKTDITTQINNYDGTTIKGMRDQVAEHATQIGKISSTVSDVQSTLTSKADGSTVQTLANKVAKVEQDANGFKQTVEQNYIQKNDLKVSSRNLLRNSKSLIYKDYRLSTTTPVTYLLDQNGIYLTDELDNALSLD